MVRGLRLLIPISLMLHSLILFLYDLDIGVLGRTSVSSEPSDDGYLYVLCRHSLYGGGKDPIAQLNSNSRYLFSIVCQSGAWGSS